MASGTLNTCGTFIDFRVSVLRYSYYLRYCYLIVQSSNKVHASTWLSHKAQELKTLTALQYY